jgi:hypothetical protein
MSNLFTRSGSVGGLGGRPPRSTRPRIGPLASMSPQSTWAGLAADNGFADQAHLVREFRAFGAEPPTHVFTTEWYDATGISRASGPAQGVRSVQDPMPRPKL